MHTDLPLWRDVRNAVFPSFPDAPGAKNVFATLMVLRLCPRSHTPNAITTASAKANQAVAYCLAPSFFQIRQSQVWVRDPAARYARVVCERFAPKETRGRGECRAPVAPAASRADLGFQHCAADLLFEYYRQFEQLQRFRRGRQRCQHHQQCLHIFFKPDHAECESRWRDLYQQRNDLGRRGVGPDGEHHEQRQSGQSELCVRVARATCCGESPCRRATAETDSPLATISATIRALSSSLHVRRRPAPVNTSSR